MCEFETEVKRKRFETVVGGRETLYTVCVKTVKREMWWLVVLTNRRRGGRGWTDLHVRIVERYTSPSIFCQAPAPCEVIANHESCAKRVRANRTMAK